MVSPLASARLAWLMRSETAFPARRIILLCLLHYWAGSSVCPVNSISPGIGVLPGPSKNEPFCSVGKGPSKADSRQSSTEGSTRGRPKGRPISPQPRSRVVDQAWRNYRGPDVRTPHQSPRQRAKSENGQANRARSMDSEQPLGHYDSANASNILVFASDNPADWRTGEGDQVELENLHFENIRRQLKRELSQTKRQTNQERLPSRPRSRSVSVTTAAKYQSLIAALRVKSKVPRIALSSRNKK